MIDLINLGTTYDYYFYELNDTEIERMNCTFADPVIIMNTTNFQRYKYECFSRDLDFGIATFSIMSAPGLLLSLIIFCRLEKDFKKSCLFILASPILCITYPIILFCVRVSGKWIENLLHFKTTFTYYLSKHFTRFLSIITKCSIWSS